MGLDDGLFLRNSKIGTIVTLTTFDGGIFCENWNGCSDRLPCQEGYFCNYDYDNTHGFCELCAWVDSGRCFFDGLPLKGAEECDKMCGSSFHLEFPSSCKFCPDTTKSFRETNDEADEIKKCNLCPNDDMKYADRSNVMRIFGPDADCSAVYFYLSMYIDANDQRCELAQMFNYICGCEGNGYVGADTKAKRTALEWLPRVMALLSFLVRIFYTKIRTLVQKICVW